jgi:pimeloyl-ACP methyl ester carboxylesterase
MDRAPVSLQTPGGTLRVGGIGVLGLLRADLPDGRTIAGIPTFVKAIQEGNFTTLTTRISQMHASLSKSLNLMTLAVDCSSGWTAERFAGANAEAAVAVMRNVNLQWDPEICRAIVGTPGVPPRIGPIDTPALFVTGTLDVNAPVAQTERIRRHFKTSARLLVVNGAHETLPAEAVQEQVLRFLRGQRPAAETVTLP